MKTRIYNARILTMEENQLIFEGELHVEGAHITYVGKQKKDADKIEWDRQINAGRNLLMPGFKNAHTHSPMTFLRSFADDLPLQPWLSDVVFPAEAHLTEEMSYWLTQLAIMEYLTSGITACFDMYFLREGAARAVKDSGYRMAFCGALNDFCESAEKIERDYLKYNQEELLSFKLGFHAEYTTGEERLRQIAALAEKYKAPVFTHLAETKKEVEDCKKRTGMTPLAYLDSLGIFAYGGGCFHMVHLEEGDYDIIRKRGISCVTNPGSNVKLASGIAPVCRMLEEGMTVAIGTDGPASNNALDMFREMYLAAALQKIAQKDAACMQAGEVLKMATVNGAKAMGLNDCDVLRPGKKADMILIDMEQPNMYPVFEKTIQKNLVYSGSKQNVKMTMVNGKILYENGQFFTGINKDDVYKEVQRIVCLAFDGGNCYDKKQGN